MSPLYSLANRNQFLRPPPHPPHRGRIVKMTLFITVHKHRFPQWPWEISHKFWSNRRQLSWF